MSIFKNQKRLNGVVSFLILSSVLLSQALMAESPQLKFTKVSDLQGVVDIANAGDGSNRVFLVEKAGRIFILKNGQTLAEPFLDIRNWVAVGGEQGLLSLAFAPDYGSSGYFYIWYTQNGGETVLSRFKTSSNPNIADRDSEQKLLPVS